MAGTTRKRLVILIAGFLCGIVSAAVFTMPALDREPMTTGASAA